MGDAVFDIPCEESDESSSGSDDDDNNGDGVERPRSTMHCKAYKRRMEIWKKEIKGVGQVFMSTVAVRSSIWKYAIANRFEYIYVRNYRQCIAARCAAPGCGFGQGEIVFGVLSSRDIERLAIGDGNEGVVYEVLEGTRTCVNASDR